jgi:D-amino-acid dehydrogenase
MTLSKPMKYDVIVLGAGMVGLSAALELQKRGRKTVLVDRRPAAEETSYGNAGIIQREGVMPYPFPRDLSKLLRYALNREPEANVHWRDLPHLAPWLYRYWRNGTPERVLRTARAANPLIRDCLSAHKAWIEEAGVGHLVRDAGYLQLYRDAGKLGAAARDKGETRDRFDITFDCLDRDAIAALEPHLAGDFAGAIHVTQPASVSDPEALGKAYVDLFKAAGGDFRTADAHTLEEIATGWRVQNVEGPIEAPEAVIALGPWSGEILAMFGITVPLAGKRGYHMHYAAKGNATLSRPVLDTDNGFVMTPMTRGIRLTTGAEFARLGAPPTPVQLARVEPVAREIFPLGERVEERPWLGARPCLPDMLPVIGPVPGRKGLWADFGHHHLGFTLGPVSARLLADMITGAEPFTDPAPYRIDRF